HFDLQKSTDGLIFKKITEVNAGKIEYLAYDLSDAYAQNAWYRLGIVDMDGKMAYSNVIRVSADSSLTESGINLFPNPGSHYINITGASGSGTISFVNNAGVVVKERKFSSNNAVNIADLKPGIYYVILFNGKKRMTSKFNKR
ncbi:MAG: T9SS type A sorting domain-containing protein, partial [Flavitalea sp.]